MKINRFLLAICLSFATMLTLSCSSDNSEDSNQSLPSNSSEGETGGSYLGYGYDVINSSYINRSDVKISHPILDQKKMSKDAMIVAEKIAGEQDFQMFAGSDLKTFYTDRNSGFGLNLGYSNVLFSGKFGLEFSGAMSESKIDSNSYVRGRSYRYTQDDYIKGATPQKLADYLTQDFIDVLKTVSPGSASGSVSYRQSAWMTVKGGDGWDGTVDKGDWNSEGGNGAKLKKDEKGNSEDFGGSNGGQRQGTKTTAAQYGGGGYGGYANNNGGTGGKGFAVIKIMYYTLEE